MAYAAGDFAEQKGRGFLEVIGGAFGVVLYVMAVQKVVLKAVPVPIRVLHYRISAFSAAADAAATIHD